MSNVKGISFVGLQVRDVEKSAQFYETKLGLQRAPSAPPGAVVFATAPVPFAVREPPPGTDLDSGQPGLGVALWLAADDVQGLHDSLLESGVEIAVEPFDGPFGRTFAFKDLDGFVLTVAG